MNEAQKMGTTQQPLLKTLPNGLRLTLGRQPHRSIVNFGLFVEHGASYETLQNNGISHFIEHVLFHGTHMKPSSQALLETLVDAGMKYGAYTSKDYTRFVLTCLPRQVPEAIRLLGAVASNRDVSVDAIEHERPIILHEHAMSFSSSRIVYTEMLDYSIWGNDSLGLFVIGRRENIERFSKPDLDEVIGRHYVPNRAHLVAYGAFDPAVLLDHAHQHFQGWASSDTPLEMAHAAAKPEFVALPSQGQRVDLLFGFLGVPFASPDRLAMELLADILGAGLKSRLFVELVERKKLAYLVHVYPVTYRRGGYIGVRVNGARQDVTEICDCVATQLQRLREDGICATELDRAKAGRTMELLCMSENSEKHLHVAGLRAMLDGSFSLSKEIERIREVRIEDVERLAQAILTPANASMVGLGLSETELQGQFETSP